MRRPTIHATLPRAHPRPLARVRMGWSLLVLAVVLVACSGGTLVVAGGAGPSGAPRTTEVAGLTPTEAPGSSLDAAAARATPATAPPAATQPAKLKASQRVAVPLKLPAFKMDIYRAGTFVSQIDKHHCMSAAMQNMLNLIGPRVDTTAATQRRISDLAHRLSDDALDHTWGPNGWAKGMAQLGAGTYVVVVYRTRAAQLKAAVEALRRTGRPVGILAWWGAHSWVLTGFRATADPALTDRYTVSAYNIVDPWYPRVSTIWGRSAPPDALHSPANMVHNLPAWTRPEGHYPDRDGKWLLVLPVDSPDARGGPSDRQGPYLSPMSGVVVRA